MSEIPAGSSLDHAGIDRRTYEDPNCGNTSAHGQHIHEVMKGLRLNCPGSFGSHRWRCGCLKNDAGAHRVGCPDHPEGVRGR